MTTAGDATASTAPGAVHVVVVGAGIIGSCIAYRLRARGLRVTLVDHDEPGRGCSFGNSGAISPGSVAPLAMPGVLRALPGMLLDATSPLYLPAGYLLRALPWLVRFAASARPARVARSADALAALHADAVALHQALAREVGVPELIVRRGHLHLYPDAAAAGKDAAAWRMRAAHGYRFAALDRDGILALEPRIGPRYTHGLFLADHATIVDPFRYVQAIASAAVGRGVTLRRAEVTALRPAAGGWSVESREASLACTHVVVAGGAWSKALVEPLGVSLALESQRGYHVQYRGPSPVTRTVVLADRKVFLTPMTEGLRVGGTVEIGGLDAPPDARRAALLARIAEETFPTLDAAGATTWMGHRPCMPDSVPVIGPAGRHPGLLLAVGHGHLGMTDSVRTAERIASAIG